GSVQDAEGALHFDGEVDVARGVDQVEPVALPLDGGGGGRDGDAALALLLHPVEGGVAVVDVADLVGPAREVQDAFARGRLARVDVRDDADVPDLVLVYHKLRPKIPKLGCEILAGTGADCNPLKGVRPSSGGRARSCGRPGGGSRRRWGGPPRR